MQVNRKIAEKPQELNFPFNQTGIELAVEEAIKNSQQIRDSLDRIRSFVYRMRSTEENYGRTWRRTNLCDRIEGIRVKEDVSH
jgi:hypothetical protein